MEIGARTVCPSGLSMRDCMSEFTAPVPIEKQDCYKLTHLHGKRSLPFLGGVARLPQDFAVGHGTILSPHRLATRCLRPMGEQQSLGVSLPFCI